MTSIICNLLCRRNIPSFVRRLSSVAVVRRLSSVAVVRRPSSVVRRPSPVVRDFWCSSGGGCLDTLKNKSCLTKSSDFLQKLTLLLKFARQMGGGDKKGRGRGRRGCFFFIHFFSVSNPFPSDEKSTASGKRSSAFGLAPLGIKTPWIKDCVFSSSLF